MATLTDHLRETQRFTRRTLAIGASVFLLSLILIARLAYLQVYEHHRYTTLSQKNQLALLPISPNRGLLYDRNGVLLAENIPVFSLEVFPNAVHGLKKTIANLQKIIPISQDDVDTFYEQLKQHRPYESVPLRVNLTEKEIALFSVNQYRFPGVDVKARLIRHYPLGEKLAHVLGYVARINEKELEEVDETNYRSTNFIGKSGIEKYYETELHGQIGYQQVESDVRGHIVRTVNNIPPVPGYNLYLTIDSQLSDVALKALGNERGAVIAISPQNGEILAMISNPAYNPNLFVAGISQKDYKTLSQSPDQPLYNRAIRGQYPLGSTIKPFLSLEALDKNIVTGNYAIWDPGWFQLPDSTHTYHDWTHSAGHGWVQMKRAITVSCDVYFYHLATLMGIKRIDQVLEAFGFGQATNIDIDGELSGVVASPSWKKKNKGRSWYPGDTINSGIGQGFMLTTPLQLATATATLANRGVRVEPHLLMRQELPDTSYVPYRIKAQKRVPIKNEAIWNDVIAGMEQVIINQEGTGHRFGIPKGYTVAAKTGTAQVFSLKERRNIAMEDIPLRLRDHSLFIAFAPIKHPQIALAVVVENSILAPLVARQVLDAYFIKHPLKDKENFMNLLAIWTNTLHHRQTHFTYKNTWHRLHLDPFLLGTLCLLISTGLLILYSASNQSQAVMYQQLIRIGLASLILFVCAQIPPETYRNWALPLFVGTFLLLLAVLLIGKIGKGAQRWLDLGLLRFQPSELLKIAVPMVIARYLSEKPLPPRFSHLLIASLMAILPGLLIAKQPDLGTAAIVIAAGLSVLLFAGISGRFMGVLSLITLTLTPIIWHFMHDYQRQRLLTFINPERDPLGKGYHIIQSKIAIGSGGLFGKGWLNGSQSHLNFLPEHATDFIYAVSGEEFGFLGNVFILMLFLLITWRIFVIACAAPTSFSRLLVGSLGLTFFISIFVNIGMVTGILPVVGLPLPFISYGGTSLLTQMASFGIIMSIHSHRKFLRP